MQRKSWLILLGWTFLLIALRTLKFNLNLGAHSATLVSFTVILPLIAYFMPTLRASALVGGAWFFLHILHSIPLTAGIPTLLATLSWRASAQNGLANRALHIAFPALAIALFALSPNGLAALPYTLFWLIPIALAFFRPTLFGRALQSTFIAHAAGSLIWAYLTPLTSTRWLTLIPVVAVERLLAATLSIGAIALLSALHRSAIPRAVRFCEFGPGETKQNRFERTRPLHSVQGE